MSAMTSRQYESWRADMNHLRAALVAAQAERQQRESMAGREPGWVLYERQVMCDEVNRLRARRGLSPVSMDAVLAKENLACGHVDYTVKYAIGCADLVGAS